MIHSWPQADLEAYQEKHRAKTYHSWQAQELERCKADYAYFLNSYVWIENATEQDWIPFDLWPMQAQTLQDFIEHDKIIVLKARQLGLTWLVLGYVLAEMLFSPINIALFFSRGETEAKDLLIRLKGMYNRLPSWLQTAKPTTDNTLNFGLSNGSRAQSFPTTGGRSYTASIVVVDEADFIDDLNKVMNAVKPTIDAGGKMILVSTVDKGKPESAFKKMYRSAKRKLSEWLPVFLPWHSRPSRDAAWYAEQTADILARTSALDDLHQEYPATDTEALAPRTLDKRIPAPWIEDCYTEMAGNLPQDAPALPNLIVYRKPQANRLYVIGVDPAEGNPTSDDSALTVMDVQTGEEVATLAGKIQPTTLAGYADQIGIWYNEAGIMVERNNHGHAVIATLEQNSKLRRLPGHDGKEGWLSNHLGKTLLYNELADTFHDKDTTLHSFDAYTQIASIEGSTLRAPDGQHDDKADAYALANVGRIAMMVQTVGMRQGAVRGRGGTSMVRSATRASRA